MLRRCPSLFGLAEPWRVRTGDRGQLKPPPQFGKFIRARKRLHRRPKSGHQIPNAEGGRRSDSQPPPSLSRVTPSAVSEHFSELLGCPISRSLTTSRVCLELRPLPSPGITRLHRYCEPLRHPSTPRPSLTGVRLIIPDHALGFPVLPALSLCTCCRHYPGAAEGRTPRSYSPIRISLPRKGCRVGLHIGIFEACSAFTHVAARTLARSPIRDPLPEGFRHFVTSMPAPVASGWSGCRVGLAPTGKAPPYHGAHGKRS